MSVNALVNEMPRKPKVERTNELYRYRQSMGWNQFEAAEQIGVSIATYQRLEAKPDLPKIYKLALAGLKSNRRK